MATAEQVKTFINTLSELAVSEYCKRKAAGRKWTLPSVCIAQAALETGWGTSPLMAKAHAYFGIKAGSNWKGKAYCTKTNECYDGINLTSITDVFRAYDSLADSVADYYDLITGLDRYSAACNQINPRKCIQAIYDGGYATGPNYVRDVVSIISHNNLTRFDKGGTAVTKIEKAIRQMEEWAKDDAHGYDQIYRWGEKGDYDCSSATIQALENAGIPVKSNGASYTGNMKSVLLRCGFKNVTSKVNRKTGAGLRRGDVLLNEAKHVAMYCGGGMEVEASINEKGTATHGKPGDQTGREFLIRPYRDYPWDCILRFADTTSYIPTPDSEKAQNDDEKKMHTIDYVARITKDTKCYLDVGESAVQSKMFPLIKKDTLVDVMQYRKKDSAGKTWHFVRLPHPTEGFVYEFIQSGSLRQLK